VNNEPKRMSNELGKIWLEAESHHFPGQTEEHHKKISQGSWSQDHNMNPFHPNETEETFTQLRC